MMNISEGNIICEGREGKSKNLYLADVNCEERLHSFGVTNSLNENICICTTLYSNSVYHLTHDWYQDISESFLITSQKDHDWCGWYKDKGGQGHYFVDIRAHMQTKVVNSDKKFGNGSTEKSEDISKCSRSII